MSGSIWLRLQLASIEYWLSTAVHLPVASWSLLGAAICDVLIAGFIFYHERRRTRSVDESLRRRFRDEEVKA
jgi:hypothetical protein